MTPRGVRLTIARKEFGDALRSRVVWAIVAVIAAVSSLSAALPLLVPEADVGAGPEAAIGGASQFAGLLVPIMALIAAYLSVAGERESGSLKVLLGLPPSRGEVLAGKFLGRGVAVAAGIAAGFAISGVVTAALYAALPVGAFLATTALTVLLAVSFLGIAVGISAVTATRARAMTLAITAYLGLTLLWDLAPNGVHLLVTGRLPGAGVPAWFLLVRGLSPTGAYNALVGRPLLGDAGVAAATGGPAPAFLSPVVFLAVMVAWAAVPLAVGYLGFRRADLS
ncbi:ABC transporter permease subunit [Halorubrum sp. SD612]|uniref:ABC transporter permease subunit n=1 Tax=Halorubrum sp. SD612 TaxID=1855863 RepID=UPI000A2D2959|nr:ABC transporter permease subunit [Halorubrum sp. SD612]OTF11573.1 NosY protein [Halorubrum sp. SD612]